MRRRPISCLLTFLAFAPLVHAEGASLAFENKTLEVKAKLGAEEVTLVFPFKNPSSETIEIARKASACDCIKAEFKDGKMSYKPGETGEVTAIFKIGNLQGIVKKNVVIWQKGDEANQPSIVLSAEIEIPEAVSITPKSLKWKNGEASEAKTYKISIHEGETIQLTDAVSTNNHFALQLKTITEGKEYEITVTPKNTNEASFAIIKISTDSKNPRFRRLQGFATIIH